MKTPPAYRLFAASGITKPAHPARVALVTYLFCDLHRNARRLPTSFGGIAGANEGTSPASSAPPPGGGNRASSENAPTAGGAGPDQERTAQATDECRDTIQSSPVPRRESKTLQHQVQEIYRLVDGAIESLEQVLRALRTIDKDL